MVDDKKITLRGVAITKDALEEKYTFEMSDEEWKIFASKLLHSWNTDEEAIRKLVFGHVKKSLEDTGFKLDIAPTGLVFKKS